MPGNSCCSWTGSPAGVGVMVGLSAKAELIGVPHVMSGSRRGLAPAGTVRERRVGALAGGAEPRLDACRSGHVVARWASERAAITARRRGARGEVLDRVAAGCVRRTRRGAPSHPA